MPDSSETLFAAALRRSGIKPAELVRRVGSPLTKQTVYKLQRGLQPMSADWARRIAPVLGVDWPSLIDPATQTPPAAAARPPTLADGSGSV